MKILINNEDDFFKFQSTVEKETGKKIILTPREYPCKASWILSEDKIN